MIEIKPLGNPDDILREAQSSEPPKPQESPINPETHDSVEIYGVGQMGSEESQRSPLIQSVQVPPHTAQNKGSLSPKPLEPTIPLGNDKPFAYSLPVFSYVLVWFYLVFVSLAAYSLIQSSIQYSGQINKFEVQITERYSGSSRASVSFQEQIKSTIKTQKESYEKSYQQSVTKNLITIVVGSSLIFLLLSGRRILRYIALGIAVLVLGYEVYTLIDLSINAAGRGLSAGQLFGPYISLYLPFILLPAATIVHLLMPKALQAYK